MVIFHGELLNNQRVIYITNNKQALRSWLPSCAIPRIKPHRSALRRSRELLPEVKDREFLQSRPGSAMDRTCRTCRTCTLRKSQLPSSRHTKSYWNPRGFPRKWSSKCWVFHIFISSLGVAKIPMFCRTLHWSGQGSYTSPVVRGTVISSWCPENVRLWLLCLFFLFTDNSRW